jgi:hypothetical protein
MAPTAMAVIASNRRITPEHVNPRISMKTSARISMKLARRTMLKPRPLAHSKLDKSMRLVTEEATIATHRHLNAIRKEEAGLFRHSTKWDMVMICLLLFTATVTPYEACFLQPQGFDFLFVVNRIVDLGFIVDMCRMFNTVVYNEKTGELVRDRKKIAMAYIKGWFFIDLLSITPVPFDIIAATQSSSPSAMTVASMDELAVASPSEVKVARMIRMMRLGKVCGTNCTNKTMNFICTHSNSI